MKIAPALHDFVPAARNGEVKERERGDRAADHDRSLDEIGPNHGLNAAEGGVDRRENDNGDGRPHINPERLGFVRPRAANHFIRERKRDGSDVQTSAGGKQTRDHEDCGCSVLTSHAESRGEVFVDREHLVVIVRLNENVADENPADDRAEGELQVGVVAMAEPFAGSTEKSAGAGFGGNEGGEHSPPRNATAAEGEVFEVVLLSAHAQADENDDDEVEKENASIDDEAAVHEMDYLATNGHG